MRWHVLFPGCTSDDPGQWLVPFVQPDRHNFTFVPTPQPEGIRWHSRSRRRVPLSEWFTYYRQTRTARTSRPEGVVTVFPQLAVLAGMLVHHTPLVACAFNVGKTYGGIQRVAASRAMRRFSRICVSTRGEISRYSGWLRVPEDRFVFFPLQRPQIPRIACEDAESPFVVAIGSAQRDYRTFCDAMGRTSLPGLIVAAPHALRDVHIPSNIRVISGGLSYEQCRLLAQRARVNVISLNGTSTPCGTVTVVEAMRMRCAIVATRCVGIDDYLEHERSGLLVAPGDVQGMAAAIQRLWDDESDRGRLATSACCFAEANLSDEAAGERLCGILSDVAREWSL